MKKRIRPIVTPQEAAMKLKDMYMAIRGGHTSPEDAAYAWKASEWIERLNRDLLIAERERDDARMEICELDSRTTPISGQGTTQEIAKSRGWSYLYTGRK